MPARRARAAPRHHGLAAALRRPVPPARHPRLRGVCARAVRPRAGRGPRRRDRGRGWGTCKQLDDDLQIGDLEAAADYLVDARRRARGRRCIGLLHGRHAGAEGRGHRALRPRGRVLRDDPRPRRLGRPEDAASRSTPSPTCARRSRSSAAATTYTPAADIEALRAAWANRPDCEIVVYDEAEHGFVHAPERPAHRADDAADAWRRVLAFLLPDSPTG